MEKEILDFLKENKVRITDKRRLIVKHIVGLQSCFSVQMILETIANDLQKGRTDIDIDQSTIYRFIGKLHAIGIIREISSIGGELYYGLSLNSIPSHSHFFCKKCRKVICLAPFSLKDTFSLFSQLDKYKIEDINLVIKGVCESCVKLD